MTVRREARKGRDSQKREDLRNGLYKTLVGEKGTC